MNLLFVLIPIFCLFLIGVLLRKSGLMHKDDGDVLLKLIFYVAAPALSFHSLLQIRLDANMVLFPIAAVMLAGINYILATGVANILKLPKPSRGVFLISSMIINTGFIYPFVIGAFGPEGIARVAIFDLVSSTLTFTWIYAIACQHNPKAQNHKTIAKKILVSPFIWATLLGLLCNLYTISVPENIITLTESLGLLVAPLFMISLGIYFDPKIVKLGPTLSAIGIRMVLGTLIGFLLAGMFNLEGVNREILILLAASPIGINTITFASLENLDRELAASIVSLGLLVGLVLTPLLLFVLN